MKVVKINTFHNTAQFKQSLFTQESYLQVEKKPKNKTARMITERKNGYVRKYLLKGNGKKILISELQLNEQPLLSKGKSQIPTSNTSMEMLDYLNISSQYRSISLKK
ncbi:hypothetical protein [Rummeliibacillus pycnus]|uniref:hypothetical protein n=1 Tax=Rummeliibacillus pycnus TaxID=101070 RepID=UPI000C9A443C|nr:hypothetical protein [Rummeliibacillus pycnus]